MNGQMIVTTPRIGHLQDLWTAQGLKIGTYAQVAGMMVRVWPEVKKS